MPDSKKETLKKVTKSRDKWRERSNEHQFERRKLQDKVRYLKKRLKIKEEEISDLKNELKKKLS